MEAYHGLVKRLVKALEAAEVDYAFTGALAASFYGLPRSTTDVDVMVRVPSEVSKRRLVDSLGEAGVRADEKQIDRALASGYNLVRFADEKTVYSVDIILLRGEFEKKAGIAAGVHAFFQTPEDLILAKLRMIKVTVPKERSFKDEEDIRAILRFSGVDIEIIRKKAEKETTLSFFEALTAGEDSNV